MVTKTITPVITKVTTHNSHSEPAISVGHVQGLKPTDPLLLKCSKLAIFNVKIPFQDIPPMPMGPPSMLQSSTPPSTLSTLTQLLGTMAQSPMLVRKRNFRVLASKIRSCPYLKNLSTIPGPAVSQGVAIQQGSVAVAAQPQPALLAAGPVGYAGQGQAVAYQQAAPAFAGPVGYAGQGQAFAYQQAAPAFAGPIGYAGHGHAVAYQQAAPVAYAHAAPAYAHAQPLAPGKIGTFDTGSYLHSHGYSGHF